VTNEGDTVLTAPESARSPQRRDRMRNYFGITVVLIAFGLGQTCRVFGLDPKRSIGQFVHTSWLAKDGAPGPIRAIAQTTDGYLWLGTADGLYRFYGIRFERFHPSGGAKVPAIDVSCMLPTGDGGMWIGFRHGGVSFLRNGRNVNFGTSQGIPDGRVWGLARDRDGVERYYAKW
jgi:ligand-binding sensor domain-containing protein